MKKPKKIFITGGCGFIGSHLSEYFFYKYENAEIFIYDKMTYAAHISNIKKIRKSKRVKFIKKDICNLNFLLKFSKDSDLLIHAAAESHVDNSFIMSNKFIETNILGTKNVMEACLVNKIKNIIHISTDEVYGEIFEGKFLENSALKPSNPYSSSKAAAEMIVSGYQMSYKLPTIIVRPNNIYGTRQHPEKLIAGCIWCIIKDKKFALHGNGNQKRTFLHVYDFCKSIDILYQSGIKKEIYNVGTENEFKNSEIINLICEISGKNYDSLVTQVPDRLFNDSRYSINYEKIKRLGWNSKIKIKNGIEEVLNWTKLNHKNFHR